jgi:hypothetical protein
MIDQGQSGRNLEGRCCGLFALLSQHLVGGTKENHEEPKSGFRVMRPIFEPKAPQIQAQSLICVPTFSMRSNIGN